MMNQAQINMQKQQLKTCGIHNESLLNLLAEVPREAFVPEKFREMAFSDFRIPLSHDQTMMTPLEEATILQALDVQKDQTVLEIGTGSGYLTALLAKQAKQVISLEYYEDLANNAQKKLSKHDINNVTLMVADGIHGYIEKAPYDVIVLTGGVEHLDKSFHPQLLSGGKMMVILGKSPALEACLLTLDHQGKWHNQMLFETNIQPLINRHKKSEFQF